jgi:ABC-type multidrug transport system ATPase subunit
MADSSGTAQGRSVRGPEIEYREVHTGWDVYQGAAIAGERAEALAGLSLILPAGQVTALLGDRRSGKSLVALHLLGEVPLHSGKVISNGRSVWEMPERQRMMLHDQVGVLRGGTRIRESHIDVRASVRANLVARLGRSDLRKSAEDAESAEDAAEVWLRDYALSRDADALPDDLGPAARRRLAVALALAWDPALVVLDDPGEALDYEHLELLVGAFKRWHARSGSTVLITLHSLEVARALSQKVAVLRDGKVAAEGTPEQLLDGVIDDETFEGRFRTGLGGVAETDSVRLSKLRTDDVRWGGSYLDLGRPLRRAR